MSEDAKKEKRFDPFGPFARAITEWLRDQALNAIKAGKTALEADFEWATFASARPSLVEAIVKAHPGKKGDVRKLARQNYSACFSRFIKYCQSGAGTYYCDYISISQFTHSFFCQ